MPWWDVTLMVLCLIVAGMTALFGVLTIASAQTSSKMYAREARLWQVLRQSGERADARVLAVARHSGKLTKGGTWGKQVAAVELAVAFVDHEGVQHEAAIPTFIETDLLANFIKGSPLAVVYAAQQPSLVAIDRDRTTLEIAPR